MQNFKQFLEEANQPDFAPWHISDPEKVKKWMDNNASQGSWRVNKDGTVSVSKVDYAPTGVYGDIGGVGEGKAALMVKYRNAKDFIINASKLDSLWGVPDKCNKLEIMCHGLKSLEHCTSEVGQLFLYTPSIENFECKVNVNHLKISDIGKCSYKDLHKHFTFFGVAPTITFMPDAFGRLYKQPLLSLLKTKAHLTFNVMGDNYDKPEIVELRQVFKILNDAKGSILKAQQGLLSTKNLLAYANL
jgi:hypothetical protein